MGRAVEAAVLGGNGGQWLAGVGTLKMGEGSTYTPIYTFDAFVGCIVDRTIVGRIYQPSNKYAALHPVSPNIDPLFFTHHRIFILEGRPITIEFLLNKS